ncbi:MULTISPECIES: nucleotide exchange factor GrpE [unclassified Amycolatopsis]|uniref:nucleotide exchange factor GrpE n=1 Tax=unclassified Amycolatopsis TaxID=2618356 RepID=UPI0028763996|nr:MULTISPECIES: nucleotide exchange factor GrpE [unclassified Amycolatopsis]MDS0134632.1 nucleotide exchange factor GrpE [Amycolatopsis sp. 505]MDS0147469.1 nucleotide exchange factor GrpE [Amycolatopsis sp. CM201R]
MATTGKSAESGTAAADAAGTGAEPRPQDAPVSAAGQDRIRELEAKAAECEDRWRRAMADADNTRKRHVAELRAERAAERARVAAAFLPVIDNLELALAHAEADPTAVVQGVLAIRDQAVQLLTGLGYERDDESGVPFDPARHEVVAVVDEPGTEPNTVTRVVRPGYGTGGGQLRPTAVTVAQPRR